MTFEQDGMPIATSDRSHVNGEVHKYGDNSFVFPIGKDKMYRPGGMIQLGEFPTSFGAEYQAFNKLSLSGLKREAATAAITLIVLHPQK